MSPLPVPYIRQINQNACGAAALMMIYKYYGLEDVGQKDIYEKYAEKEPHGSGNFRIRTEHMVQDARDRNFEADWNCVNYVDSDESMDELRILIHEFKIPVIVCQKYTNREPLIGHFRVVLDMTETDVLLHDPDIIIGEASQKWPIEKFMQFWQRTGDNVVGGVMIAIRPKGL